MSYTPTGELGLALDALMRSIAASATFQAWVGAEDAEEAAAAIHLETPPPPAGGEYTAAERIAMRPMAVVQMATPARIYRDGADPGSVTASGEFAVLFESNWPEDGSGNEPLMQMADTVSLIAQQMVGGSATAEHLLIHTLSVGPVRRGHPDEVVTEGDYLVVRVEGIAWGTQGG